MKKNKNLFFFFFFYWDKNLRFIKVGIIRKTSFLEKGDKRRM
jgi:hypothetical protein